MVNRPAASGPVRPPRGQLSNSAQGNGFFQGCCVLSQWVTLKRRNFQWSSLFTHSLTK